MSNELERCFIEEPGETVRMEYEINHKNRGTGVEFTVPRFVLLYIIKNQWVASKKQCRGTENGVNSYVWVHLIMSASWTL